MEEELRQAKITSEAANHAKTEFIANMSHDIRTPLSGVVGMSKALEEHTSDPEEKQYAHWVNECGQQLLNLLNEILDVISAENINDSDLRLETFDLYKCIQDIAQLELPTIKLKKLDLNVSIQDNIPRYVVSDRTKLHRTILNLLGNSIKFTQEGFVAIGVKLVRKMTNTVRLEFSISDSGIGIPDELQPNVFDRFFRVNPSSKGMYKGHGLGLHIAQSYVELLGGKIKLKSKINQGTTFFFELTFKTGSPENINNNIQPVITTEIIPAAPISEPVSMSSSIMDQKTPHVLLIEDNHVALLLAEMAVKSANCRYTSAKNAEIAFQLVQSNPFDLIITDVGLPDIPGTELTQTIRKWEISTNQKPVPIIGLTAHTRQNEVQKCIKAGMNKVLIKPVTSEIIHEVVNEFINRDLNNPEDDLNDVPVLDIPTALSGIGNESVLAELLKFMVNTLPDDTGIMETAFVSNDQDKVRSQAHKIKAGALYVGTLRLQLVCQHLEDTKNPEHSNFFKTRYSQTLAVIQDTIKAITTWLESR
jgi:CheY-like chemotaxis protein